MIATLLLVTALLTAPQSTVRYHDRMTGFSLEYPANWPEPQVTCPGPNREPDVKGVLIEVVFEGFHVSGYYLRRTPSPAEWVKERTAGVPQDLISSAQVKYGEVTAIRQVERHQSRLVVSYHMTMKGWGWVLAADCIPGTLDTTDAHLKRAVQSFRFTQKN